MKMEHKRCSNVVLTSSKPIKRCSGAEGRRDQWSSFGWVTVHPLLSEEDCPYYHLSYLFANLAPNSLSFYQQIELTLKINDILLALWLFELYVSDLIKIEKRKYQNDLHYQE